MKKFVKQLISLLLAGMLLIGLSLPAAALELDTQELLSHPELTGDPIAGQWYQISPKGAKSADGEQWHGLIRIGDPDKIIVYFVGGGACIDGYTAARPILDDGNDGFYYTGKPQDLTEHFGFLSRSVWNPFHDWTVLLMSYTTGDFHIGNGTYTYTDKDGTKTVIRHNGYKNYRKFMNRAMKYVEKPSKVIIAGSSAGGFGAALLADDVLTNYFPKVKNTTVVVDASMLLTSKWPTIVKKQWQAPKSITKNLHSSNITLDALRALSKKRPKVKILFDCSVRDGELTKYQNYISNGTYKATNKQGDKFQKNLKTMVKSLRKQKNTGIFIWDGLGYNDETNLTQHTNLLPPYFYLYPFDGKTMSSWLMDAVNGSVESYGLEKLDQSY